MTILVSETYVIGCGRCYAAIEAMVSYALRDPTITSLTLKGNSKDHCHTTLEKMSLTPGAGIRLTPSTKEPPPGNLFAINDAEATEPNGFDPDRRPHPGL